MNDKAPRRPRRDGPPTGEPTAGDRSGDGDRTGTPVLTGGIPPRDAALVEVPPPRAAPPKPAGDGAAGAGEGAASDGGESTRDVAGPNRVIGLVKNDAAQAGVFEQVRQTTLDHTGVDITTADDDVARAAIEKSLRNEAVEQAGAGVVFDPGRVIGVDPRDLTDSELQDKVGFLASDHEAGALLDKDPADITPQDRRGLADEIHRAELEAVLGIPSDRATALERLAGEQLLRNRGAGFDVTDEQARLNELVNRNPGRGNGGDDDGGSGVGGDSVGGGAGGGSGSGNPGGNRPPAGGSGSGDLGPRPGDDGGGGGRPGGGTEPPAGNPGPPPGSEAWDVDGISVTGDDLGSATANPSTETYFRTPDGQWVNSDGSPVDSDTAAALEDGRNGTAGFGTRNPDRDTPPSSGSGSDSGNGSGGSGDNGGSGSGSGGGGGNGSDGSGSDGSGSGDGDNDTDSGTDGDDTDSGESGDSGDSGTDTNSGEDDDDPDTELSPDPDADLDLPPGLEDVFNRFDMVGQGIANLRAQQTASGANPDSTPDPTNTVPLGAPNLGNATLGLIGNDQRGVDSGPPILGGNTTPSFGGQAGAIDPGPDASIGSATGPELELEIPVADGAAAHLLDDDLPPLAGSDDSDDDQDDDGDLAAD